MIGEISAVSRKELALEHHHADLGDVCLHYVEAGSGSLIVLLHGFPEFWYSWRFQIPILAEAGFRLVEPTSAEEELVHVRLAGAHPARQVRAGEYFRPVHLELPQASFAPGNIHRGRYPTLHRGDETSRRLTEGPYKRGRQRREDDGE